MTGPLGLFVKMTEGKMTDRRIIHGVLVAVFDRGTLIIGPSCAGKSELALELISRGHHLVADDAVSIFRRGDGLIGEAPKLTAGVLEIKGLGLIDVATIFGENAVRTNTMIDLCVDLGPGPNEKDLDLLSENRTVKELLGVSVPLVRFDVSTRPANPIMIETAVRMLEHPSANVARRVAAEHDSSIIHSSPIPQ